MNVQILAIDKLRNPNFKALADDYGQRIARTVGFSVVEKRPVKHANPDEVKRRETEALLDAKPSDHILIALDERGSSMMSRKFAGKLQEWRDLNQSLSFAIGGANGHDKEMRKRANLVLALSPMTMAHELARVVLLEQIYRGFSIITGSPYHRD